MLVEQVVKAVVHLGLSLTTMFDVLGLGGHLVCAEEKLAKGAIDMLDTIVYGLVRKRFTSCLLLSLLVSSGCR